MMNWTPELRHVATSCLKVTILLALCCFIVSVYKWKSIDSSSAVVSVHKSFNSSACANHSSCDDECQRFCQYMTSSKWPTDKPKAAIYILTQGSRSSSLNVLIQSLDKFFNDKFRYPVIIFHEKETPPLDKLAIKTNTKSVVFFQQITMEIPDFLNRSLVPETVLCIGRNSIAYRNMCRFHAKAVFDLEILKVLEYIWRLDDDSLLTKPIQYDLFLHMRKNNIQYGFHFIAVETNDCIAGLWETADEYISRRRSGKTKAYSSWNRTLTYFNNFEISNVSIWLSDPYQTFVDYIDRTGNIYFVRWGDAPIKTIAVKLFVPDEKVHYFKDVGYVHGYDNQNQ